MRTTITINDDLYEKAKQLANLRANKPSAVVKKALETYIRVQAGNRLAALGGTAPDMQSIPRRRSGSRA